MVTKEQLVCTRNQSLLLNRKGVPQRSIYEWTQVYDKINTGYINVLEDNYGEGVAAFTTAELMEMLPKMGLIKRVLFYLRTGLEPQKVADYLISKL